MPVLVEPSEVEGERIAASVSGTLHRVREVATAHEWLARHRGEHAVVVGPGVDLDELAGLGDHLRRAHPAVSLVLVRRAADADVLALAVRAGARDVVTAGDPDLGADLDRALDRARELAQALRGRTDAAARGRVTTVFSPKGGVGKTTVAVNLALALTDHGARRVCLVDLDLAFGDVAITLQLFPMRSIEQAVGRESDLDLAALEPLLTRHPDGLLVLPAPAHPDVRERISPALVTAVLRTLRGHVDHVVVDTAPAFDDATLCALDETDDCVLVTTLDVPTLKNLKVGLETMDLLGHAVGRRHLVLNRADDAVGIDAAQVESILSLPVAARAATSTAVAAATTRGRPIVLSDPDHPASQAVRRLADRLTGEEAGPDAGAGEPARTTPAVSGAAGPARSARTLLSRRGR